MDTKWPDKHWTADSCVHWITPWPVTGHLLRGQASLVSTTSGGPPIKRQYLSDYSALWKFTRDNAEVGRPDLWYVMLPNVWLYCISDPPPIFMIHPVTCTYCYFSVCQNQSYASESYDLTLSWIYKLLSSRENKRKIKFNDQIILFKYIKSCIVYNTKDLHSIPDVLLLIFFLFIFCLLVFS